VAWITVCGGRSLTSVRPRMTKVNVRSPICSRHVTNPHLNVGEKKEKKLAT
jgi:hypothetical protein